VSHSFEVLQLDVIRWAEDRGIIKNSNAKTQFMKAVSEMGELADAVNKEDRAGVIDGLGDVMVCLINMATIMDLDLKECLAAAYEEIKDRKGYLNAEGVFIKEQ
jgi:uncharacterized protein YabN with tetrapyrrole methylase and pyrophosphatase domain